MKKKKVQVATYSLRGRRENNEDSIKKSVFEIDNKKIVLLSIADGMGGYKGGDLASDQAVNLFCSDMRKHLNHSLHYDQIRKYIQDTYKRINREIYKSSKSREDLQDMGTTLTSVVIIEDRYWITNVGDSRAYVIKDEDISQISEDHSAAAEAMKDGLYNLTDLKQMPYQNALTRNLGNEYDIEVDIFPKTGFYKAGVGEIICLLTDGITSVVTDLELYEKIISEYRLKDTCKKIANLAYEKGSDDNASIALIEIGKLVRKKQLASDYSAVKNKIKIKKPSVKTEIYCLTTILITLIVLLWFVLLIK
jgi:protein phosphatase